MHNFYHSVREGMDFNATSIRYDANLCHGMENHFVTLGIIKENFSFYTAENEAKKLIDWAYGHKIKPLI